MNVYELIAPSDWAGYLINGDESGISVDDKAQADAWILREGLGWPVSCEAYGFAWDHAATKECPCGANCEEYTFLTERD